jgi:DNA-binding transcriptional LysR family regulator
MLVGVELRHLRYFVAVAEEENASRAALRLHVSQPALSRQVRDLEDELGFALFERGARSLRLTATGRVFLGEARAVLRRTDEAVAAGRAAATGRRGELQVGYAPSLTSRILPPALRAFQDEVPAVRVLLHDLSTDAMLAGLRAGSLQLAFLARPLRRMVRGLRFEPLVLEPLRLAVPPGHPLARRRSVPVAEAVREPLVAYSRGEYPEYHETLAAVFAAAKALPRIAGEFDGVASLIASVEAGAGVAWIPESVACFSGRRLKFLPLTPEPEPLAIGAAWPRQGLTPAAERFLHHARKAFADPVRPGRR